MSRTIRKLIERPIGKGEVRKERQHIATVNYQIDVMGEYLVNERTGEQVEGVGETTGTITLVKGGPLELGDDLTLHLADGRVWDFAPSYTNDDRVYQATNRDIRGVRSAP